MIMSPRINAGRNQRHRHHLEDDPSGVSGLSTGCQWSAGGPEPRGDRRGPTLAAASRPLRSAAGPGAARPQDTPAFALGGSSPYAVLDVVCQRVLQAGRSHRAVRTHLLGGLDADPVAREEHSWGTFSAPRRRHPGYGRDFVGRGHMGTPTPPENAVARPRMGSTLAVTSAKPAGPAVRAATAAPGLTGNPPDGSARVAPGHDDRTEDSAVAVRR